MVDFDDNIFAAGHCFDWNEHPYYKGLFCPFGYRLPPPDQGSVLVKNLAADYPYLGNTSEWFFHARKNAEKVIEKNEQYTRGKWVNFFNLLNLRSKEQRQRVQIILYHSTERLSIQI